ncbi:endolytic transglycosylase MltG [Anaerosphaera multitolerans]|uniref:Endolytic transglycosylase MltG n=1 Tax=Anaerosphaera multitolerans TaxID=2487351 RepID=A0A437S6E8_9FIRM|nr:endolytic transglycosylase MltG [Anaerosphaera multitolerans]RVU54586.1 hypothetical protein EF514_06580 [Anaerosphaera multitolerans]
MKIFNAIADFFFKIVRILIVLLVIFILGFLIKWKMDTLYMQNIAQSKITFTIKDEFNKTYNDIKSLFVKNEETQAVLPVVEDTVSKNMVQVTIPQEATVDDIGRELIDKKLMTDLNAFKNLAYNMGLENKFVRGTYEINKDSKIRDTILILTNTQSKEFEVEISEGAAADAVGKKLQKMGIIESADAFAAQCKKLGCFYKFKPGTYTIETPTRVIKIIETMTGEKYN